MFAELLIVFFAFLVLIMIKNCSFLLGMSTCGIAAYLYTYFRLCVLQRDIVDIFLISEVVNKLSCCLGKLKYVYQMCRSAFVFPQTSEETNLLASNSPSKLPTSKHCGKFPSLEAEIDAIVIEISERYIQSWYHKLSEREVFVNELNIIIKDILIAICSSVLKVVRQQFFGYNILQIYLHYFHHFTEAEKDTSGRINWQKFKMKHWATKDKVTEWCYLQNLISSLLDSFGPVEYHNSLHSRSNFLLHAMIVEILTENVIYPFINIVTDSSHLNTWLLKSLTNNKKEECEEMIKNIATATLIPEFTSELFDDSKNEHIAASSGPKILLSTDDSPTKYLNHTLKYSSKLSSSDNLLSIPFSNNDSTSTNEINDSLQYSESDNDNLFEGAVVNLLTTGLKSRSNVNLLDTEYPNRSMIEDMSSVFYDGPPIKRSKSADYIRQMSQLDGLMPLNTRNNSIKLHGRDNKTFVVFKCDSNVAGDIEEAEEATEIELPPLFSDIQIVDTVQVEIAPLPYTLYCIQYTGIFHDIRKSTNPPELVKHVVCIKRRFREFVALQSRLEDNFSMRTCLKGIKGPSKWLATPFSNLDKKNISERKFFLEGYLKELCGQDAIARSSELQEFLAYGGDASIAFVKRAADISMPRIDKMLFRGMRVAIDLFRTALPNAPEAASVSELPFEEPNYEYRFHDHAMEYNSRESEMQEHIRNYFQYFDENSSSESVYDGSKILESKLKKPSLMRQMYELKVEDSCKCKDVIDHATEYFLMKENPFGDITIDLFVELLQNNIEIPEGILSKFLKVLELLQINIKNPESILSSSKRIFGPSINNFFKKKFDEVSEEKFAILLHALHQSLWNNGNTSEKNEPNPAVLTDVKDKIKEHLKVYSTSSYTIQVMEESFLKIIDDLLDSIQDQQLNRCLLFHVFDVIIECLCSREKN